ncbi:FtsK/SpoIIIE domain-containing protein [Streptomyces tateyamensis]|uniref:FtsK/SpoIIIE domain-containing protein n=1 Tax=Streptomyces tateyamensis TaxID=565073 RepID=UPI001FEA41B8|nr:FtsK/SpoIIIE domain-containing protein [Streptomyces tateyamensis]
MAAAPAGHGVPLGLWLLVVGALVVGGLASASPWLRRAHPHAWWALAGFPVAVARVLWTWRRLAEVQNLSVAKRSQLAVVNQVVVRGRALKLVKPKLSLPRWRLGGLEVVVRLHPGQVPEQYAAAAEAMVHAWRVFAVRAISEKRGFVVLRAQAWDPLAVPFVPQVRSAGRLSAVVGILETGVWWRVNLRETPHVLAVGATRSGKSTLIAALVAQLARQKVALVGIDLKGAMELGLFERRLTALASSRAEAGPLLDRLVEIMTGRMARCRAEGVRSVWELPRLLQPVPIVVFVDEVAELFLMASSAEKNEVAQCSTALLRIGQLGAALGVHLVVAGQRFGSDLGPGATAIRSQLAGRIAFRVLDKGTAEMVLGDTAPDAVDAVQAISADMPGTALVSDTSTGGFLRARTHVVTVEQARKVAEEYAHLAPGLDELWAAGGGAA